MKSSVLVVNRRPPGSEKSCSDSGRVVCVPFPKKSRRKEEKPDNTGNFLPAA